MGKSKEILARFVVEVDEAPMPFEKANKLLGALKLSEIESVLKSFMELLTSDAINPTSAAKS